MQITKLLKTILTINVVILTASSGQAENKPINLLFVGNSYCDFNVLPNQVAALLTESGQPAKAKRQTKGGFSWKKHWNAGEAQKRINDEGYDIVVLQNHSKSSLNGRPDFDVYGQKFIDLVKTTSAKPILYLTWAREDSPEDQKTITEAYCTLGVKNKISIAPVGEAFKAFIKKYPEVKMHIQDKSHPSMVGSYLAACVFYSTITGKSPVGLSGSIDGFNWVTKGQKLADLDPEMAKKIQMTAWETVKSFNPAKLADPHHKFAAVNASPTAKVAENTQGAAIDGDAIHINFGGKKKVHGWNNVGGKKAPAKVLVNAQGEATTATIEVHDAFQDYVNTHVVDVGLTGEAANFKPAADATLFTNRKEENPTGGVTLKLDPKKTYTFKIWASRTGSGKRWAKYIVKGEQEVIQYMAAGHESPKGNPSTVLTYGKVKPDAEGKVTVTVAFPGPGDPQVNLGDFTYLTGMIIQPE